MNDTAKPPQGPPPDVFIASFNCFLIQTAPGAPIIVQVTGDNGAKININFDPETSETFGHVMFAAAARAKMRPLPPPSVEATARRPQPPAPSRQAADEDHGLVTDPVDKMTDGGTLQ